MEQPLSTEITRKDIATLRIAASIQNDAQVSASIGPLDADWKPPSVITAPRHACNNALTASVLRSSSCYHQGLGPVPPPNRRAGPDSSAIRRSLCQQWRWKPQCRRYRVSDPLSCAVLLRPHFDQ